MDKYKLSKVLSHILTLLLLSAVVVLIVLVQQQKEEIQKMAIISIDEVGIDCIDEETIEFAKFDSHIPDYAYEITDYQVVAEVLSSLDKAVFQRCDKPVDVTWMETIYIETNKHEYIIGVENGVFRITIDEETNYYRCSLKGDFIEKICELQGR